MNGEHGIKPLARQAAGDVRDQFEEGPEPLRIAYFDPFSGASGDMILGALLDAGLPLDDLKHELAKLDLPGYELRAECAGQHGLAGTRAIVEFAADQPDRDWATIRDLIAGSGLEDATKRSALAIFARLAEAEGRVHG